MKKLFSISIILGALISLSIHSLNAQVSYTGCSNSGTNSSALGNNSSTSGNYSFAFGYYTKASANNSFSFGSGTYVQGGGLGSVSYLQNNTPNSFLLGFNNTPVFFAQLRSETDFYSSDLKRVGIGTNSPKTALDVEGTIRTQNLRILNDIRYTGSSLTIDYQPELTVTMSHEPLLTLKDGKVGILNSNPTAALDVGGDMKVQGFEINNLRVGSRIEFTQPSLSFIKVINNPGDTAIIIDDPETSVQKSGFADNYSYILTMKGSNIGIGTQNPTAKLHVAGTSYFNGALLINSSTNYQDEADIAIKNKWFFTSGASNVIGHNWRTNPRDATDMARAQSGAASAIFFDATGNIRLRTAISDAANTNITSFQETVMANNGNIGIGISSGSTPTQKLHVVGNTYITGNVGIGIQNASKKLHVEGETYLNGKVSIAGTNSDANTKLFVNGTIGCSKVVVAVGEASSVPDYVFEPDYELMPLQEVESYVQEHKHLPEIPSAQQVVEEGLSLSEMNLLLLKKVEELTLYIIEQEKRIETLEKRF